MKLIKLLVKARLIKIQKSDIKKAAEKKDIRFLDYAYTNGQYYIRQKVIEELVKLHNIDTVSILEKAIYDKIHKISIMAIEMLACYPNPKRLKMIENRLEFWEKEAKRKSFLRKNKRKPSAYYWDSSSMQNVKQEAMQNMKKFGDSAAYL